MTPMKAGAIALTLIIAVPILLGYGLASEETTKDVDVTENTGSLSDIILNSTTPYYVTYAGANNNNTLFRVTQAQGSTYSSLINPDFVQTSSTTYTYTPIYSTGTATVNLPSTSNTYSNPDYPTLRSYGIGSGVSYDTELPSFAIAGLTIAGSPGGYGIQYSVDSVVSTVYVNPNQEFYAMASGDGYLISGTNSDSEDFSAQCDGFSISILTSLTMYYKEFYTIPDSFPDVWSTNLSGHLVLNLTVGSDTTAVAYTDADSLVVSYNTVTVTHGTENDIYSDVTGIGYAQSLSSSNFVYSYQSSTIETYADVSYGWTTPTSSYVHYDYWMNGFVNSYVRMMIHMEANETFEISSHYTDSVVALYLTSDSLNRVTAKIYGTDYDLGRYTDMMIEVDAATGYITVTGIASWPSIGSLPETTYNSVTGYSGVITEDFTELFITDINTHAVELRVDSAQIVAGYFPSTKDYALNVGHLYPESTRQSVIIDSVGIYGDSLGFWYSGAPHYDVTDGTITVDGTVIPIKGMKIDFEKVGTGTTAWNISANGHFITTAGSPTVIFNGEWSLTLHHAETTTESVVQNSWVAGEFALDENGFVMAMLLVALAAFVALGMTGGRSGAKVGILALICGGAVLTGLIII